MRIESRGLFLSLLLLCLGAAAPAEAQFVPAGGAIGENYHFEAGINWWNPEPDLIINSESLGILGTDIDLMEDLGIEQKRHAEIRLVARPARKHKLRFNYLPIKYETDNVRVTREFVFNGQRYRVGVPVSTTVDFKTYRFGYEYDFLYMNRGYLGAIFEVKYNDVKVELNSLIGEEFTSQVVPIPTIGLAGRGYVSRNVSITGEFSFMKVPDDLSDDFDGQWFDLDIYSTVNITNNVGAQLGYRTLDVVYEKDFDRGNLEFRGWYFGGVVRF